MLYSSDYLWFQNYNQSDIFFVDETINWDESLSYTAYPYFVLLSTLSSSWNNSQLSLSSLSFLSFLEVIFTSTALTSSYPSNLSTAFYLDIILLLNSKYGISQLSFFHTDYHDLVTEFFFNSPELALGLNDWFVMVKLGDKVEDSPQALFDIYQDVLSLTLSEFVESVILLVIYFWLITFVVRSLRLRKISQSLNPHLTRLYFYFVSYAFETRLQLDAVFEAFYLVALFFGMMILTFDDDREEIIEFLNLGLFYLFLSVFVVHCWKYSVHYLSFLDSSRKGTSSTWALIGQYLFDVLNVIGFSLRFVLLMARLNIYDGIDDILDSYYVCFIDFDEEEYYMDSFTDFSAFSYFDTDVQDDRSFLLEDENDLVLDLYVLYLVVWGKYVLFLFFFLEELARVGLALFVTLLLILEINAVTRSYTEDSYILHKLS